MQDASAAVMSSRTAAAAAADAAVRESVEQRKRFVVQHAFAELLRSNNTALLWDERFTDIVRMLRVEAARVQPLHLLSQPSATGERLLTSLLKFLAYDRGEDLKE